MPRIRRFVRPLTPSLRTATSYLLFALFIVGLPSTVVAYPGQQLLEWVAPNILAPIAFLSFVVALAVAKFRPQLAMGAVYVLIAAVVMFFVINSGTTIIGLLQR